MNAKPNTRPDVTHEVATQAKKIIHDFVDSDPNLKAKKLGKDLANEMTAFIKANPWAAVLGAAAIGYFLGTIRGGQR